MVTIFYSEAVVYSLNKNEIYCTIIQKGLCLSYLMTWITLEQDGYTLVPLFKEEPKIPEILPGYILYNIKIKNGIYKDFLGYILLEDKEIKEVKLN